MTYRPPPYPPPHHPPPVPGGGPQRNRVLAIVGGALITVLGTALVALFSLLPSGGGFVVFAVLIPFVCLVVGLGLLFAENTRPWGIGMVIGFFVMLIVGAGACVALIAGLNSTSRG